MKPRSLLLLVFLAGSAGSCRTILGIDEPERKAGQAGGSAGDGGEDSTGAAGGSGGGSKTGGTGGRSETGGAGGSSGGSKTGGTGGRSETGGTSVGSGEGGSSGEGGLSGEAGAGGASCTGERMHLLLWTLHLGQSDYVTLKNPTDCQIDLEGLEVLFDDREDAFPPDAGPLALDCTVRLPEAMLPPGGSIRVHEDARPGDIAALANAIAGCDRDVPFNPQRGGVTYLCNEACSADTVIDVIAHQGYDSSYGAPPELRFGVTFLVPLSGIGDESQDLMRYRRRSTQSTRPNFTGSDWKLQVRTLYADFETGLTAQIRGLDVDWGTIEGEPADITTTATTSAVGNVSLQITHTGIDGISTTLTQSLATLSSPLDISYFGRVDTAESSAGYFDLVQPPFSTLQVSFEPTGLGAERENGQRTETPFETHTWYQIELRDIDYDLRRFDLYVDRRLLARGVPFWSNALGVQELRLYSVSSGSTAYFDAIELWQ